MSERNSALPILRAFQRHGLHLRADRLVGSRIPGQDDTPFIQLYFAHADKPYFPGLMASVSKLSLAWVIEGPDAIATWRTIMGPTDPVRARQEAPQSLRALYGGATLPDNAVHGSDSAESAAREIAIFFPELGT